MRVRFPQKESEQEKDESTLEIQNGQMVLEAEASSRSLAWALPFLALAFSWPQIQLVAAPLVRVQVEEQAEVCSALGQVALFQHWHR